jgi:hypothetical protein
MYNPIRPYTALLNKIRSLLLRNALLENKQDKLDPNHIPCIDDGLLKPILKNSLSKIAEIEVNPNAMPKPDHSEINLISLLLAVQEETEDPSNMPKAVKENHRAPYYLVFINEKGEGEEIKISEINAI